MVTFLGSQGLKRGRIVGNPNKIVGCNRNIRAKSGIFLSFGAPYFGSPVHSVRG